MMMAIELEVDAELVIRRHMRGLGLSQKELGMQVGRSQGWVSQELLRDSEKTVRHQMVKNPNALRDLLSALRWSERGFSCETGIELPGTCLEAMGAWPTTMTRVPPLGLVSAGQG